MAAKEGYQQLQTFVSFEKLDRAARILTKGQMVHLRESLGMASLSSQEQVWGAW